MIDSGHSIVVILSNHVLYREKYMHVVFNVFKMLCTFILFSCCEIKFEFIFEGSIKKNPTVKVKGKVKVQGQNLYWIKHPIDSHPCR